MSSHLQQVILQTELGVEGHEKMLLLPGESGGQDADVVCTPGLFAVWGETQSEFIAFNLTKEELVEMFVERARNDITRKVLATCHELQCGEQPYAQFTKTFADAVHRGQMTHGIEHYEFEMKEQKDG